MEWTPNLRLENTGCCHPNLRSLQLSLFLSSLSFGVHTSSGDDCSVCPFNLENYLLQVLRRGSLLAMIFTRPTNSYR